MPDKTSYEVRSVGYFLKYENDKIYLAGDISGDEVARIFVIPQGCIKGFRKLK